MWICINLQKIKLLYWLVFETWLIKKSCNLIVWEHFYLYLSNQNFPKYGICAVTQNNINFYHRTSSVKTNEQIFQWIQKIPFLDIFSPSSQFWGQKHFLGNSALWRRTSYRLLATCQNLEKNKYSKKTPGQTKGQMDGRTDRPYFIGPFRLLLAVQNNLKSLRKALCGKAN